MEKVTYTDEQFMKRLGDLKGNQSALAREMGISVQAIAKRRKKLIANKVNDAGRVAAVIRRTTGTRVSEAIVKSTQKTITTAIASGEEDIQRSLDVMSMLIESNKIFGDILTEIRQEIEKRGKSNPLQRKQLILLGDKIAGLAKTYFDIQSSLFNARSAKIFIEAVLYELQQEDINFKRRVLKRLGDCAAFFNSDNGHISATGSD